MFVKIGQALQRKHVTCLAGLRGLNRTQRSVTELRIAMISEIFLSYRLFVLGKISKLRMLFRLVQHSSANNVYIVDWEVSSHSLQMVQSTFFKHLESF